MAWRTINNVSSRLRAALASGTGSFTLLYARRQVTDLNADTGEMEMQGSAPSRIAGIVSSGNGTDFYGHATVGTTWVGAETGDVASIVNQWGWRLIVGSGTSLRFFSAPDNASSSWTEWPDSPLTQTVFAVDDLFLGSNGREAGVHDFAAIRLWNVPKTPSALVAERASPSAIDSSGLVLDKLGIGDNLSASLAAGTGTLTAQGTISLNADLPASIVLEAPSPTTSVTVGGRLSVDPLITVEASSVGDTVSFSGEYSSISESPTITVLLKDGGSTVDTATPTGDGSAYSGSFTSVANGTYTVEASISDSETSAGSSAASDSVVVNEAAVPPDAPTGLTVTGYTTTTISLSWSQSGSVDQFQVEIAYGWPNVIWAYPESAAHTWQNLTPATAYGFRVRAQKDGLWSAWTEVVEQTTLPAAPAAPSVAATVLSDSSIRIDWSNVGATEYRAYRKASPGGARTLIYTGSGLTFTDIGLSEGSIYYYDVSATNVSATTFSSEVSATTLQSDGPPRLIVQAPPVAQVGQEFEARVQSVTGRGDAMIAESITITPSLSVTGTLTAATDSQGYATFLLTPTEAGDLTLAAASAEANQSAVVQVSPEEDAATIAARLAAAEKKSTRTTPKPSPAPLDGFAPPLELMPAESVSPLAALLNEMLLAPQMPLEPISLSEFMPALPAAPPPPSNGTQKAIEALDQVIAAQMQRLSQQLETLNRLIE